jgi:hypothetical protein
VKETLSWLPVQVGLHRQFELTPLESAAPESSFRHSFITCTCEPPSDLRILKHLQPGNCSRNSFTINTYDTPSDLWQSEGL